MSNELRMWRREFANDVVGESPALFTALDTVRRAAPTDFSILIAGETGTGKELLARAVHRASARRKNAFIAVNCAAIPDTLLETELFGHVRGAFTGASAPRSGRFAAANGGTLFLDEVGDLPLSAQAKLLRVLEHGVVCPLGSDTELPVDVRIVCATHRDLEDMVAKGTFRGDLYYRLAVVPVELPALRDRGDDLDLLADAAVAGANKKTGLHVSGIDASGREALRAYAWPGNVRELTHRIERAVVLAGAGELTARELRMSTGRAANGTPPRPFPALVPPPVEATPTETPIPSGVTVNHTLDLRTALEHLEKRLIEEALQRAQGNRTEAAALLGLNRTTLVEKLRKYAG
ncbi:MAG: sigma 54-interacting transcriptional regulator [Deltaproteobacteria bacterium]|nr:sigma 54-interacting transcriptional regulator [Deltaproteobacteria bacterium]